MTNLTKLKVSLTKHGAHKVAALLMTYPPDEVLAHVWDNDLGIKIEVAQARQNLSASRSGQLPPVWDVAKERGSETLNALVMVAIIFSHHELIRAMRQSTNKKAFAGTIKRGNVLDGKAYTNFAHIIEELGYSTEHSADHLNYDLHKLFQIKNLNSLVAEILKLKLEVADWDKKKSVVDESCALGFHEVFGVTQTQFKGWLNTGSLSVVDSQGMTAEDAAFFEAADDEPATGTFKFQSGHNNKKTGTVSVKQSKKEITADLLHNKIQNELFISLKMQYGDDCVGTENGTGHRTAIDVVVNTPSFCWFYEIKTAESVKACIRQAIPQLLEYAYWHGSDDRADRLYIVSVHPITKQAETYLAFLRKRFGLEIYYHQHTLAT